VSGQVTPDLRGRFIVGINTASITVPSGQAAAAVSGSQPTYNRAAVGGFTASTVPPHRHTFDAFARHQIQVIGSSQITMLGLGHNSNGNPPTATHVAANSATLITDTGNNGGLSDSRWRLKTSTPVDGESGGDNRPPYYALAFIMRVA
jgi:hypothetical protein